MKKYNYFISYISEKEGATFIKNGIIGRNQKIKELEDIELIEKKILQETDYTRVVVINLMLL